MSTTSVTWFEIPVSDMDRAIKFYEKVFQIKIQILDLGGFVMGMMPGNQNGPGASGSLVKHESYVPSMEGVLVYLGCNDLQNELDRIQEAGGSVKQGKTQISEEHGFMAVFIDSEGNRLALHSNS